MSYWSATPELYHIIWYSTLKYSRLIFSQFLTIYVLILAQIKETFHLPFFHQTKLRNQIEFNHVRDDNNFCRKSRTACQKHLKYWWCTQSTAEKMNFSIGDFFSKCDQILNFKWIWSHLLRKFLIVNFIFCMMIFLYLKRL